MNVFNCLDSCHPSPGLPQPAGRRPVAIAVRVMVAVFAVTGLCSCKSELYERLDERDANDMLATLYAAGIQAGKSTRDEKTWSVEVDERDLPTALRIVAVHGLPREQFANVGDVFKKEGLVSTPSEERIRYIYAVSQELSNTLSQIDGVIVARVHPVIPANDPLATQIRPSSASVFIKYRRDADLQALAPPIKNLIMRSIEGLQYENISLTFVPAEDLAHGGLTPISASGAGPVKAAFIGGAGMLFILAMGGGGYIWNRYRQGGRVTSGAGGLSAPDPGPWASRVR
jgi:type III secretion protein J